MKTEDLLLGLGFNRIEAKILYSLLRNESMTANQIEKTANVTRSRVYQVLKGFIKKGIIYTSKDWPKKYSINKSTISFIKEKINSLSDTFLSEIRTETTDSFRRKVTNLIEKIGFSINEFPTRDLKLPSVIRTNNIFSFIACDNKIIRFGCILIDKTNEEFFNNFFESYPMEIFIDEIINITNQVGCLAPFLFIDPNISSKSIAENINQGIKDYLQMNFSSNKGFENNPIFVSSNNEIEKNIDNVVRTITERHQIIYETEKEIIKLIGKIDERLSLIDNLSSLSEMIVSQPPTNQNIEKIKLIKKPIEEIILREKRNKDLVKQKYVFKYVEIMKMLESIDSRLYMPVPDRFNQTKNEIDEINKKLDPIIFELKSLKNEVLGYIIQKRSFNPFIFTVPTNKDKFVANQENIKISFENFCKQIPESTTPLVRLIKGPEGMGKSHLLRNCLGNFSEKNNLLFIYISCQINKDFIEDISKQIIEYLKTDSRFESKSLLEKYDYNLSTDPDEFILLLLEIQKLLQEKKLSGLVIAIDEFENAIEAPFISGFHINHLKKIITKAISSLGIVISCRDDRFDSLKHELGEYSIYHWTDEVKPIQKSYLKELIKNRCNNWDQPILNVDDEILDLIIQKTNNNTRDVIKYLRAIYYKSVSKEMITKADIEKLQIPIFKMVKQLGSNGLKLD